MTAGTERRVVPPTTTTTTPPGSTGRGADRRRSRAFGSMRTGEIGRAHV